MSELFTIELSRDDQVIPALNRAIAGLEHPKALYQAIGAALETNVNLRFRTKRDPNNVPWPKISDLTPIIYARINKTARIDNDGQLVVPPLPGSLLDRTRRMLGSLAANPSDTGLELGFSVPYAIYHETGTERNGKPYMPRRGMLLGDPKAGTLGAEDRADVQDVIDNYLSNLLGT
jgi:phage gpG-like protein